MGAGTLSPVIAVIFTSLHRSLNLLFDDSLAMVIRVSHNPCPLPGPVSSKSFWHSEPDEFLLGHRSTPDLPGSADVVIVGSG